MAALKHAGWKAWVYAAAFAALGFVVSVFIFFDSCALPGPSHCSSTFDYPDVVFGAALIWALLGLPVVVILLVVGALREQRNYRLKQKQ